MLILAKLQRRGDAFGNGAAFQQLVLRFEKIVRTGVVGFDLAGLDDFHGLPIDLDADRRSIKRRHHQCAYAADRDEGDHDGGDQPFPLVEDAPVFEEILGKAAFRLRWRCAVSKGAIGVAHGRRGCLTHGGQAGGAVIVAEIMVHARHLPPPPHARGPRDHGCGQHLRRFRSSEPIKKILRSSRVIELP